MILKGSGWPRLSGPRLAAVIGCGALAIGVSLTTVAAQVEPVPGAKSTPKAEPNDTGAPRPAPVATQPAPARTPPQIVPQTSATPYAPIPSAGPSNAARPESPQSPKHGISTVIVAQPEGLALYQSDPLTIDSSDSEQRKLLKQKYNEALEAMQPFAIKHPVSLDNLLAAARRVRDAEVALNDDKPTTDDLKPYSRYCQFTSYLVRQARAKTVGSTAGETSSQELIRMSEARDDAVRLYLEMPRVLWRRKASLPASGSNDQETSTAKNAAAIATGRTQSLPAMLTAAPLSRAPDDDDVHKQLKGRYESAFKSLQLQFEQECRKCHTNPTKEQWHRAADIQIGQRGGEPALEKRTGGKIQSLKLRVRIAEGEVNAARAVVDQTEAELKRVLTNLKYRQAQLDRVQSVRKQAPGTISDTGLEEAIRACDDAAAGVDAAKAAIRGAQAQVEIKGAQLEQVHLELKQAASEGK